MLCYCYDGAYVEKNSKYPATISDGKYFILQIRRDVIV